MLPTFVIGLREGLEAALIVGIIAAFLRKQGRRDLLRWVFIGVGTAVLLCVGVGIALDQLSRDLPQKQQEGLETIIGILAVGMVTYMVIWMRRHARELKGQLEGMASDAMSGASRAGRAMVLMAFLAVLREGFETVVFLLAAFNESGSGSAAALGAVLGIAVAVVLGYGIYRGGVRINLSKFFRATGLVLVLVAAGLVVNALSTAHEAGWLNAGQGSTIDLTWLVRPGSVEASLLTGMLGVQQHPVVIEIIGWLVYLVPVGCYVAWPPGRSLPRRAVSRALLVAGGLAMVATAVFAFVAPSRPAAHPATAADGITAQLVSARGGQAVIRTQQQSPAAGQIGGLADVAVRRTGDAQLSGVTTDVYAAAVPGAGDLQLPAMLSYERIAALNGGHLPIGLHPTAAGSAPVTYKPANTLTVWVEPRTGRILDLRWRERVTVIVTDPSVGALVLSGPAKDASTGFPSATTRSAASAARHDSSSLDRHALFVGLAWTAGVIGLLLLLAGGAFAIAPRRRASVPTTPTPSVDLVRS